MQQPDSTSPGKDQIRALVDLYTQGRLQEALAQGVALAERHPNAPIIQNLLGAVFTGLGRKEEAVASYRKALEIKPDYIEAHHNLGNILYGLGEHEAAVASYRRVLELKPDYVEVHHNLGDMLYGLGKYEEALASYRKALELKPDYVRAQHNLGTTLNALGKHEEALAGYRRALELKPDFAEAYFNLGTTYNVLGKYEEVVASYRRALELKPDYIEAHQNLGAAFVVLGKHEEAIASFQKVIDLDPSHTLARSALLHQLGYICDWDRIEETIHVDLKLLEPGSRPKEVAAPFCLLALIDDARFHRRVSESYVLANYNSGSTTGASFKSSNPDRIRIGYFSSDFHDHATMYLMAELFERHDRSKFEIHAFSFGPDRKNEMRSRVVKSIEAFHDVRLMGDAGIADLSRSSGIDIAVDLKGYTLDSRAGIFSYRAAPVQVNYLGYPGTMGAPYIDYIIADPVLIPPTHREFYTEKVAYLPGSYQVNDSTRKVSDKAMSRSGFGLPEDAFVFCCFNNNYKITPDVFDIWMRLLGKIQGSVLWILKSTDLAEQNLRKEALKRGINPDRLIFAERIIPSEHLARHRLADLFLDTFNCNAHTTASDALWAGLPILTKMGESFASRVAGSLLNAMELPELITTTAQEYEDTALMLATHPHELEVIKEKLGNNLKTTALFDTALFTRHIEAAFTQMYKRLNEGLEPDHFYVEN